jgi:hypothetical protein
METSLLKENIAGHTLARFLCLSSAALFLPAWVVNSQTEGIGLALLALSFVLFLLQKARPMPAKRALLFEGLAAAILLLWMHGPWSLAFALLLIADLGALSLLRIWPWMHHPVLALRRLSWWFLLGLVLMRPVLFLNLMLQHDRLASTVALGFTRLASIPSALISGQLWLESADHFTPFIMSPEWTGLFFKSLAFFVIALALFRQEKPLRCIAFFTPLALLLHGLGVLIQSEIMLAFHFYEWPFEAWWHILFSLPILLAGIAICPRQTSPQPLPDTHRQSLALRSLLPAFLAFILIGLALHLEPNGEVKSGGRILIDEGHSNWEWADEAMTPDIFGTRTTYNYYGLHQLLKQYYDAKLNDLPLCDSLLATTDVLILKTPTAPYTDEEKAAILRFVDAGGGLYLISDHTDIFGMSSFINPLARELGFEYNFDVVFDLFELKDQHWAAPASRPHPAAQHLDTYRYLTGCSIRPFLGSRMAMLGHPAGTSLLSYSTSNYFDTNPPQADLRFGSILQLVSARYGQGRVLGFSDSTTYSNFAIFWPGRLEHLLGAMDWLMRRDARLPRGLLLMGLGMALLVLARMRGFTHIHLKPYLLAALALTLPLASHLQSQNYTLPQIIHPATSISFDGAHSKVLMPLHDKVDHLEALNFETFFVWLYRSNAFPVYGDAMPDERSRLHCMINPESLQEADFEALDHYMQTGGTVLLLSTPEVDRDALNPWLATHGLQILSHSLREAEVQGPGLDFPWLAPDVQLVQGGSAWFQVESGRGAAVRQKVGEGELLLSGLGRSLTNAWLGRYDSVPTGESFAVLKLYYEHVGIHWDWPEVIDKSDN